MISGWTIPDPTRCARPCAPGGFFTQKPKWYKRFYKIKCKCYQHFNAGNMKDYSHKDVPWVGAEDLQLIDYEAVFSRTDEFSVRKYND